MEKSRRNYMSRACPHPTTILHHAILTRMLKDLLEAIWLRAPRRLRRLTVRFSHARFVASAGAIITDEEGRVLLLKHRFRPGSGWGIPGGLIEADEQPAEALQRELREEVALELRNLQLFSIRTLRGQKQLEIIFRCHAQGDAGRLNFEIKKAGWFSPDDLPEELPIDQARLIKRALIDGAKQHD
jgi:ADP-ribose pyrophosphatase YjhB (NUDIX family)